MVLDQGRRDHHRLPRVIAVEQAENARRFQRIPLGHFDLSALNQLVDGFRAEVRLGPVPGRKLQRDIWVAGIGCGIFDEFRIPFLSSVDLYLMCKTPSTPLPDT